MKKKSKKFDKEIKKSKNYEKEKNKEEINLKKKKKIIFKNTMMKF